MIPFIFRSKLGRVILHVSVTTVKKLIDELLLKLLNMSMVFQFIITTAKFSEDSSEPDNI